MNWLEIATSIQGWMDPEELQWLHDQASRFKIVAELGVWKGRSAYALASGCNGIVYGVDHFRGSDSELSTCHAEAVTGNIRAIAESNLSVFTNVRILPVESAVGARIIKNADMVFLDGDHELESVMEDLQIWGPVAGTLLCGHDANLPGVAMGLMMSGIPYQRGPGSIWYREVLDK